VQVLESPDRDSLLDWLQSQPVLHHDPGLGITMVHAACAAVGHSAGAPLRSRIGVFAAQRTQRPVVAEMYGNQPDCWRDDLEGADRLRFITNALTRLRVCDASGRLLLRLKGPPGNMPAGAIPWFDAPAGAGRRADRVRALVRARLPRRRRRARARHRVCLGATLTRSVSMLRGPGRRTEHPARDVQRRMMRR